ncbi:phylloplanin-like [Impatiens glandulifera]|uniref:phylloplanin-like n=1 Tax=Impatiens glandulifera TaxID=253017 RepID=UPI001FB185EB|nr:phylloplanin-like [Impatiens glandulifera]
MPSSSAQPSTSPDRWLALLMVASVLAMLVFPPFPNATVQLECGSGNVLASTTTNSAGSFSIIVNLFTNLVNILSGCKIAVPTPLSSCNASLPSTGSLFSPLQQIGPNIVNGILNVTNNGFQFLPGGD